MTREEMITAVQEAISNLDDETLEVICDWLISTPQSLSVVPANISLGLNIKTSAPSE